MGSPAKTTGPIFHLRETRIERPEDMAKKYNLNDALYTTKLLADEEFAEQFEEFYRQYAEKRAVEGMHRLIALRRVFGEEFYNSQSETMCYLIESTDLYQAAFRTALNSTPIATMWNDRKAINRLMEIAYHPNEKGSTQLRAVQELNVLIGITVVDENGRTRKGGSMADFYNSLGAKKEGEQEDGKE